jgi:hypothetical protein
MRRYALVIVGIAAVVLTGFPPGSDGCALTAATEHSCCAEPASEPISTCCSKMEAPEPGIGNETSDGCDCIHSSSTPAEAVVSTVPTASDDAESMVLKTDRRLFGLSFEAHARVKQARVRTHPPPSVFLLDCCFLI